MEFKNIIDRVKSKDRLAMGFLYEKFAKQMLNSSYRITNNLKDAEDVVQESFLSSFIKIEQLKEPSNYQFWLKRIVVNNSLKLMKSKLYYKPINDEMVHDFEETLDSNFYENIAFEKIHQSIQNLPSSSRCILTLYLLDDFKHREIADMLEISVSTSKSQYAYALRLLKKQLKAYL